MLTPAGDPPECNLPLHHDRSLPPLPEPTSIPSYKPLYGTFLCRNVNLIYSLFQAQGGEMAVKMRLKGESHKPIVLPAET